jgi:ADP-ribose pyrophosphatase
MITSWEKVSERVVYDGFRQIVRKRFLLPNGKVEEFDIFKARNTAVVCALTSSQEVIVCEQFTPGIEEVRCKLPGGYLEGEEGSIDAARREILEETGYGGALDFVATYVEGPYGTTTRSCFAARDCERLQGQKLDGSEFIDGKLMPLEEFKAALRRGAIVDAQEAYACLDYLKLL